MRLWIIDDYSPFRESIKELISDRAPDAIVKEFDGLRGKLMSEVVGPDFAIIDVSAVCPTDQAYLMGDYLWPFARKFPGTELIIMSAIAHIAKPSIEELFAENKCGNVVHFVSVSADMIDDLSDIIFASQSRG